MAILKKILKKEEKDVKKKIKKKPVSSKSKGVKTKARKAAGDVLLRPRITEKATFLAGDGVYVFEVSPRATKTDVKDAILDVYGVSAIRINITQIPNRKVFYRGKKGVKSGGKKALVYLKKGDKIEFV